MWIQQPRRGCFYRGSVVEVLRGEKAMGYIPIASPKINRPLMNKHVPRRFEIEIPGDLTESEVTE